MVDSTGSLIESQVDWLTCSAHGAAAAGNLLDLARRIAADEKANDAKARPWFTLGYEGFHVGRIEYGQRASDATIVRLIGQLAADEIDNALSVADNVTRLDIAATWRAVPPDPQHGHNSYSLAQMFWQRHPESALPSQQMDAKKGHTVYLGNRRSPTYFRLYNKHAECLATRDAFGAERYLDCWRYELEVHDQLAHRLADRVIDQEDRPGFVRDYVSTYASQHGLLPPFAPGSEMRLTPGFRRRSDADTKVEYLHRNARPALAWLRSIGQLERGLDALGLNEVPPTDH